MLGVTSVQVNRNIEILCPFNASDVWGGWRLIFFKYSLKGALNGAGPGVSFWDGASMSIQKKSGTDIPVCPVICIALMPAGSVPTFSEPAQPRRKSSPPKQAVLLFV